MHGSKYIPRLLEHCRRGEMIRQACIRIACAWASRRNRTWCSATSRMNAERFC